MPSTWEPTLESVSIPLQNVIHSNTRTLVRFRSHNQNNQPNITPEQQLALKSLSAKHEVVIKPANKGGQIVIQNRTHYIFEATRQLSNTSYYQPLIEPLYLEAQKMVKILVNQMQTKHLITTKQTLYLLGPPIYTTSQIILPPP